MPPWNTTPRSNQTSEGRLSIFSGSPYTFRLTAQDVEAAYWQFDEFEIYADCLNCEGNTPIRTPLVPEPSSALLALVAGALGLMRRRR